MGAGRAGASAARCTPARSIGGRFGAPEYTGDVAARGSACATSCRASTSATATWRSRCRARRARIERFTAKAGGGTRRSSKASASFGEAPTARLQAAAPSKFQLLGRVDRRIVASGSAQLRLDATTLALDGEFVVDEGLIDFTRSDAPSARRRRRGRAPRRQRAGAGRDTAAAAAAPAPPCRRRRARSRSTCASTWASSCACAAAASTPACAASCASRRRAAGWPSTAPCAPSTAPTPPTARSSTIDRGAAQLQRRGREPAPRHRGDAPEPRRARRRRGQRHRAEPARAAVLRARDVARSTSCRWLVLGRASDGLGRTDTALLQRAALALLAGEGGGADRPADEGDRPRRGRRCARATARCARPSSALGKQLSQRWYVGYERGLNATTGSWQLIYRIAQRFTLRAQAGRGQRARPDLDLALAVSERDAGMREFAPPRRSSMDRTAAS